MSTLSISPAFISGAAPQPRLARNSTVRLTQRGRIVIVLVALVAAVVVMLALSGWATATLEAGTPEQVRLVEVQPGDTLYGIAGEIAEPGEIREMVHRIQKLNALDGAALSAGQQLAVPVD